MSASGCGVFFVLVSWWITTVVCMLGCEDKFYFDTKLVDTALQRFYKETLGPTAWPPQFRGRWDAMDPCAWDGNERAHIAPAGTRCVTGGWHQPPPRGDGGLLFLEHASGHATGPVPEEFKAFQMTDFIGLGNNKLTGPIWNTSFHCFLHRLDLSRNQMSGELGTDFMQRAVNHLEVISLGYNQFSGPIPLSITTLKPLSSLMLNDNQFSGSVPDLSPNSKLIHLDVANNQLSGSIGGWMAALKQLAWVYLDNNKFTGSLPELPPSIVHFSASGNSWSGPIPQSYGSRALHVFNCTGCKDITCPSPDFLNHVYISTHCKKPRAWD